MSGNIGDVIMRAERILKEYQKYANFADEDAARMKSGDEFLNTVEEIKIQIRTLKQKANEIAHEKNRAVVATMNAELRRSKNQLLTQDIPKLQKLSKKGKKATREQKEKRMDQVDALMQEIEDIPDGINVRSGRNRPRNGRGGKEGREININDNGAGSNMYKYGSAYYQDTEESRGFRGEWDMARSKQDKKLDHLSKGLNTLKDIGTQMKEELDRQDPYVVAIEEKVDKAEMQLRSNNERLERLITQMRSGRKFCVDLLLIFILIGIAGYIINITKKK